MLPRGGGAGGVTALDPGDTRGPATFIPCSALDFGRSIGLWILHLISGEKLDFCGRDELLFLSWGPRWCPALGPSLALGAPDTSYEQQCVPHQENEIKQYAMCNMEFFIFFVFGFFSRLKPENFSKSKP